MISTASTAFSADQLRDRLFDVLEACPAGQCNPHDCPMFPLRQMNLSARIAWLSSLEWPDLEYLASYHYVCLRVKLGV